MLNVGHVLLAILAAGWGAAADPSTAVFSKDGVQVEVSIAGGEYTYDVINATSSPIVRFEVGQRSIYKEKAPVGWEIRTGRDTFAAWTGEPAKAIQPGLSGRFGMCVGSGGGVLGAGTARIGFADGRTIEIDRVWCSQPSSRVTGMSVSVAIALIMIAHALWLLRRRPPVETGLGIT